MRKPLRLLSLGALTACLAFGSTTAWGDPGEDHADNIPTPLPSLPVAPPGSDRLGLLDVADKDGTTNSDIAFHGDHAYVGNYDGFRVVDISRPGRLRVLSDVRCRANQGDVSVFEADDGRVILLQSIDRAVTAPDCSGVDTPTVTEQENGVTRTRARFGYEGLRMFDVTNPSQPRYLRFIRTECGSHTHTLVPSQNGRIQFAYIASYPLGSQITPGVDRQAAGNLNCDAPHSKISIVRIPNADPETATVRTKSLSSDTEPYDADGPFHAADQHGPASGQQPAFQSCHDHQAFLPRNIMIASCAGDLQYWDITNRGNPTSSNGEVHTHIKREIRTNDPTTPQDDRVESFDFVHSATVSWDGRFVTMQDESGGGGEPRCDAENTRRGWTFIYRLVRPGRRVDGFADLRGKYMIPRPQGSEICVSHNGNVLPTAQGYWQVQGFYEGGTSVWDFTRPRRPMEFAWADHETARGSSDTWAAYWYNDVIYVNGGLNRNGANGNRGFESYGLFREYDDGRLRLRQPKWKWMNPQTQEDWQVPRQLRNGGNGGNGGNGEEEDDD